MFHGLKNIISGAGYALFFESANFRNFQFRKYVWLVGDQILNKKGVMSLCQNEKFQHWLRYTTHIFNALKRVKTS